MGAHPASTIPAAPIKYRKDYQPPALLVERVSLRVEVGPRTRVHSQLQLRRNPAAPPHSPLWLDGRELTLESIAIDGEPLAPADYRLTPSGLELLAPPSQFQLSVVTEIDPDHNDSMEGFYRSGSMLCSQCEAHGFSRISYYPDRPDVLARFRVRIEADAKRYPVLLSNGHRVDSGELADGRHYAVWDDPHAKPCYLFAMVAGDLAQVCDSYTTASGRQVALHFYVDAGNEALAGHAVESLKQSMAWDERAYGLEYDLDLYQVVAARDFNMGAMENKGLNLFNARYVLASPETATDEDYQQILAVIGHEYFHNWTGNRVTCRDWFQLSLKEGLTVLREQQFCEAMGSAGVQRIRQVEFLRGQQFVEDAGPLAHPVRPEHYQEVNNFYTLTVYEKGAELLRMLRTVVGAQRFAAGVKAYLQQHDGSAATIEDFIAAQEAVSGEDLGGFRRWYSQAGTPGLSLDTEFADGRLTITASQDPPLNQPHNQPVPIPVRLRLRDRNGAVLVGAGAGELRVLEDAEARWVFEGLDSAPILVPLLEFSAPVRLHCPRPAEHLAATLLQEEDAFARWDAGQQLMIAAFLEVLGGQPQDATSVLIDALQRLAAQPTEDYTLLAELLRLPAHSLLNEQLQPMEPLRVDAARGALQQKIAHALTGPCSVWAGWSPAARDAEAVGRRALAGVAMQYLGSLPELPCRKLLLERAMGSSNMSLRMAALQALNDSPGPAREQALAEFLVFAQGQSLVLDKWFALQAASALHRSVSDIEALMQHPQFERRNPNRVRAVLGAYSRRNPGAFHASDGSGYRFLAAQVLAFEQGNPQLAARLLDPLVQWQRHAAPFAGLQQAALRQIAEQSRSPDVQELSQRALGAAS